MCSEPLAVIGEAMGKQSDDGLDGARAGLQTGRLADAAEQLPNG